MARVQIQKAELPDEIRSRVDAAAGHPDVLIIEAEADAKGDTSGGYHVYAVTGTQLIVMDCELLPNGSVRERTTSSHRSDINDIEFNDEDAVLQLRGPEGRYETTVPLAIARALSS